MSEEAVWNYEKLSPEEKAKWDAEREHEWDVEFPATLLYHQGLAEQEWAKEGKVWSWIGGRDWKFGWLSYSFMLLKRPPRACRRIIRFTLPLGDTGMPIGRKEDDGQLRVIEEFVPYHEYWQNTCAEDYSYKRNGKCGCEDEPTETVHHHRYYQHPWWDTPQADKKDRDERFSLTTNAELKITNVWDSTLYRYHGTLQSTPSFEMSAEAVVFNRGTPQAVADRAANILNLVQCQDENFYALLDGATRCAICNKPLRDKISKLVSVGPDCAKKYGIPHNLKAASERLELRKKLFGQLSV
ncbi:MAG: DUF6011 domain-containing protein [Candidatus Acidiferrales bacterium]